MASVIDELVPNAIPIDGGWHIKDLGGGRCVDVMKMLFNYRIVTSGNGHVFAEHGWCYFGHGVDDHGKLRTMQTALLAAVLAAAAWNGVGSPDGYDKQAF